MTDTGPGLSRPPSDQVQTHKELQELEDPLVGEDVESVAADGVDDGKTMDLILDQRVDGFKDAERTPQKKKKKKRDEFN